ncbi:hypothetical protein [Deinococcus sp. Leaf326]|uniref:hypothetical protein n=1 Tax=Deinococcus sp. Leaf326 TaxID=1736338 RepID=UPI0006F2C6DC|nr:hypothetical protein [Deinococcus sp. Leaf326]KQR37710.1 hypothetical protein ASF71_14615 [Deinococcus sp. Leaf326]
MTQTTTIAELNAALLAAYRRSGSSLRIPTQETYRIAEPEPFTPREGSVIIPQTLTVYLPTTVAISEEQLLAVGAVVWPLILDGLAQTRLALADRKLSLIEAGALGTTLLGIVSKAVVAGAPLLQDGNAERLVGLLFGVAWNRYVVPRLPVWLRPLAPVVYGIVVRGLEDLYRAVIKPPKLVPTP